MHPGCRESTTGLARALEGAAAPCLLGVAAWTANALVAERYAVDLRLPSQGPGHPVVMDSPQFVAEQPALGQRLLVADLRALRDYNDAFFKNDPGA